MIAPIRFDSDVKGKMARMSKVILAPEGRERVMLLRSREVRHTPTDSVHSTMATSSGDEAWYVVVPSSLVTGVT
jgi:hypothetical protein